MFTEKTSNLAVRLVGLCLLLALVGLPAQQKEVTVWLMPTEQSGPNDVASGERTRQEIEEFNRNLEGQHITVLNTQPPLDSQLLVTNPELTVVNWNWISSQRLTLAALERFAVAHSVHVNIRFITWGEAFDELRGRGAAGSGAALPDVAQIGTTWTGYFAGAGFLQSKPGASGNWRSVQNKQAAALPYINDVRLLFYWKRKPTQPPDAKEFTIDGTSWESIIESVRRQGGVGDSLAFASGLTLNLLHDYASFVWAGSGPFLTSSFHDHADLTSAEALRVPLMMTAAAHYNDPRIGPRPIVSFPDAPHEEVSRLFVNGNYRGTLEPADFISRWHIDFMEKAAKENHPERNFWDYAGVLTPPGAFKGGSELIVMSGARHPAESFALAEFLGTDPEYTETLAKYGHLPSLRSGFGLEILASQLSSAGAQNEAAPFTRAAQQAIVSGHSYPDIPAFPMKLESKANLESFQTIWRRMAEGQPQAVREAAKHTESEINGRIDWETIAGNKIESALPFFLIFLVAAAGVYIGVLRLLNERSLAGVLYHSNLHTTLPSYGLRLLSCAAEARKGIITLNGFLERVEIYATHLAGPFYNHTCSVSVALGFEMQGASMAMNAEAVTRTAETGAGIQFQAVWMETPPTLVLNIASEGSWRVKRMPHLAVIVLQEWFYNTIREIASSETEVGRCVGVRVDKKGIVVTTPIPLQAQHLETLQRKPEVRLNLVHGGMGLRLVANMMWLGYRRLPHVEYSDRERGTCIRFPFPMVTDPKGMVTDQKGDVTA